MRIDNLYFSLASAQLFPFQKQDNEVISDEVAIALAHHANTLVAKQQFVEAIKVYGEAIHQFPEQPFFYASRSMLYRVLGDEESAFYDYQIAKRIDFNYHTYLEWCENSGAMEEANELVEITEQLKQDQSSAQLYINRALLQVQHFNYLEAIEDYTNAYALDPNADILVSRAAVYLRLLKYDKALTDLDEAIAQQSSHLAAYLMRAKLFTAVRAYEWAKADYDQAILLNSTDESIFEQRAQFFEQLEDWESAIADYSVVIRQHPEDFFGYVMRADLYEKVAKFDLAIADYDKAISLNPYYSDLYQYRGDLKERIGDQSGAEADFAKFEELEEE